MSDLAKAPLVPEWTVDVFARGGLPKNGLHRRELDVLKAAAAGMGNQETADILGIGIETVKTHRRRALAVLRSKTITQAVAVAMRQGLIS